MRFSREKALRLLLNRTFYKCGGNTLNLFKVNSHRTENTFTIVREHGVYNC